VSRTLRRAGRRGRTSGVTLVEVLLAAVVVGTGLVAALSAISTSLRASRHADSLETAARLLDLQLGRIESGYLGQENATGDFTQDGEPSFNYDIEVTDTLIANMSQITITVSWMEGTTQHDENVVRYLYQDPRVQTNTQGASGSSSSSSSGSSSASSGTGSSGSTAAGSAGGF
jgi:Tfp pilus assembly protein PilV